MSEVTLLPEWREVCQYIVEHRDDGVVFTHEWLHNKFGLQFDAPTVDEYKRTQIDYMDFVSRLSNELLVRHCIMLTSVRGEGYRVAQPEEQTKLAVEQNMVKIKKHLRKMAEQVSFVDMARLTDSQKQENTNARAHIGTMRSLFTKTPLLRSTT
jgi:hypothetical protein